MGPKKKAVKKKVGKKSGSTKGPTIIDGVPVAEMTKDQLEGHVRRLQTELQREREERNLFQLERDRLTTFWEVGRKQLSECRSEARVKDKEIDEAEQRHQAEIKVYKQKVKHLLYEQETKLAEGKAENMVSLKIAREEHQKSEQLHLNDLRQMRDQLHHKDKQYRDILTDCRLKHKEEIERVRQDFESRVQDIERRYSDRFVALRSEMQLKLKSELSETEERKNEQIHNVTKKNDKAVTEMRNYYNDITLNNLAMISTLKEEMRLKDEKLERNEQQLNLVQQENKRLVEPLKKATDELTELKKQISTQEKDKSALNVARSKLKASQKQVKDLQWDLDVMKQKYQQTIRQRDEIQEKFSTSIMDLQQKANLKYLALEKKIKLMKDELDVKDAQLHSVTSDHSGRSADKLTRGKIKTEQLEETRNVVQEQGRRIRTLELELFKLREIQRIRDGLDPEGDDDFPHARADAKESKLYASFSFHSSSNSLSSA